MGAPHWESTNSAEKPHQDGFLNVQPVFRLVEYHRTRSVDDFVGYFPSPMSWEAVHKHSVRGGVLHELSIDLIGNESSETFLRFILLSHAGPHIGVHGVSSGYGFSRIAENVDRCTGFFCKVF